MEGFGVTRVVYQVHHNLATGLYAWFDTAKEKRISDWMTKEACKVWQAPVPLDAGERRQAKDRLIEILKG